MKLEPTALFWALCGALASNTDAFWTTNNSQRQCQPFLVGAITSTSTTTSTTKPHYYRYLTRRQERASDDAETKEVPLTDVDSRVLQSMLREAKLDLGTESDVRKLLERGVVKTTIQPEPAHDDESKYSSTVLKTLSDTKLWRKISVQASNVLGTVGIWVTNKVEQDVKVLAALGFFAWERAVNDVARALPATSSAVPRILLLANSSSYEEKQAVSRGKPTNRRNLMEEMNRPSDEIQSVTRAVLDILKGNGGGASARGAGGKTRGLRTAAPAGSGAAAAERQRRAYTQRRQMQRQERDVTRVAGNLVDTAWELQRELKSEASPAGYKTAGIRNAFEAGVVETGNILRGVKKEARLAATKRKERRLKESQPASTVPSSSKQAVLLQEILDERSRIIERLQTCIEEPENTWLRQDVIGASEDVQFDNAALTDIVSMMILVRNDISTPVDELNGREALESVFAELRMLRSTVEQLRARSAEAVSFAVGEALYDEILGLNTKEITSITPLVMRLDEAEASLLIGEQVELEPDDEREEDDSLPWFARTKSRPNRDESRSTHTRTCQVRETVLTADVIEVVPEVVMRTSTVERGLGEVIGEQHDGAETVVVDSNEVDGAGAGLIAEIVTDDDFDIAVGQRSAASYVPEDGLEEEKKDSILVQASLRSLDVVFFVVEKTFTVGVPRLIETSKTVSSRLDEVNRSGLGRQGWQSIRNTITGSKRY